MTQLKKIILLTMLWIFPLAAPSWAGQAEEAGQAEKAGQSGKEQP